MKTITLPLIAILLMTACSNIQHWITMLGEPPAPVVTAGNPTRGEEIFRVGLNDAPPCVGCHQVSDGGFGLGLGPKLVGISVRAGERMERYTAEAYLEDSILYPSHHIIPGFHVSMYPDYAQHLADQDVSDLVAYLMTL